VDRKAFLDSVFARLLLSFGVDKAVRMIHLLHRKWKEMGRFVRKGEKDIPILAPITRKLEDEEGIEIYQLATLRLGQVFEEFLVIASFHSKACS